MARFACQNLKMIALIGYSDANFLLTAVAVQLCYLAPYDRIISVELLSTKNVNYCSLLLCLLAATITLCISPCFLYHSLSRPFRTVHFFIGILFAFYPQILQFVFQFNLFLYFGFVWVYFFTFRKEKFWVQIIFSVFFSYFILIRCTILYAAKVTKFDRRWWDCVRWNTLKSVSRSNRSLKVTR